MKAYVPKHLRKKEELQPVDLTNESAFPVLGITQQNVWDTNKKTFKDKINDLIALEKLTEEQRLNALNKEEFEMVRLPLKREVFIAFNNKITKPIDPDETLFKVGKYSVPMSAFTDTTRFYKDLVKESPPGMYDYNGDEDYEEEDEEED